MANKYHKLIICFESKEQMLGFVKQALPEDATAYHGDAMDTEFNGVVPANSYVLRHRGDKPDEFLAENEKVGRRHA